MLLHLSSALGHPGGIQAVEGALLSALLVAAIAACLVAIFALVETVRTLRSARTLIDDVDLKLIPLIEKADVTVDALNAELMRVDGIVTRFEEVSDHVGTTTRAVQGVVNAPVEVIAEAGSRLRRWLRARERARRA